MGRVLFVATVAGHIRAFHLPFIKMLQEQGHRVEVACRQDVPLSSPAPGIEMPVWEIPFARSPYSPKNIKAYLMIRRLLREREFDLVHVNTPAAAFLTRLAGRNIRKRDAAAGRSVKLPVLYMAHGFHFYRGAPIHYRLIYYAMERLASRWTAGLIVMNREDLLAAKGFGLVEGVNLWLTHGVGVELERYSGEAMNDERCAMSEKTGQKTESQGINSFHSLMAPLQAPWQSGLRKELDLPDDAPVVACIAELIPRKNHRQLFEAWERVLREFPRAVLLVAGTGELERELRLAAGDRRFGGSIRMLGFRSDVPDLLALSDIVVLASRHEGLPRVLMEAMAAGKPVVVTDVRGDRDLVRNGVSGLLAPLDRPGLLAEALINLLGDRLMAARMGAAGRELIREYALPRVLAEMDEVYGRYLFSDEQ